MGNEWKVIPNTDDKYSVSTFGKVRSNRTGRILKPIMSSNGYFKICLGAKDRDRRIHRIVAETFLGMPPNGMECNHKDLNKTNNKLENLEWVSRSENFLHSWRNDRGRRERTKSSKLNWDLVREIRSLYKSGMRQVRISKQFGMSRPAINAIIKNRCWRIEPRAT